jgi:hypothetical protein
LRIAIPAACIEASMFSAFQASATRSMGRIVSIWLIDAGHYIARFYLRASLYGALR